MPKLEKMTAYFLCIVMLASLLPVMYLGRYNHPVGDDFYYGADTKAVWERTGSIFETAAEAAKEVGYHYQTWQGTYSAMFLMCLPPNIFGEWAYRLITFWILTMLSGGIFYVAKPLICSFLGGSGELWVIASSLLALLCVQTLPSQGEAFFWYNGSMYYTGYFAVSLFFLGLLLRYPAKPGRRRLAALGVLAVFLAGGNYVTLLPVMLTTLLAAAELLRRHSTAGKQIGGILILLLLGFAVSALAPGNQVRQSDMWKIPAWKAIAKSILQGILYFRAWTGVWLLLALFLWTPFLWSALAKTKYRFRYPLLAAGLSYGLFCSMSCPTFYTMNSTGPARAVAVNYYGFIFTVFFLYTYLLGYFYRARADGGWISALPQKAGTHTSAMGRGRVGLMLCAIALLLAVQVLSGAVGKTTVGKAVRLLKDGTAAAYEAQYQQRLLILEDASVRDVVFKPYDNQPDMLYEGDFESDPLSENNRKAAQYFHKDSICVAY